MDDSDQTAPRHPGRILLERVMQPLGISRNQLARDIDVPVGRISDLTNAKRGITADTALRLGRYFGISPDVWLRLQAEFDLHQARTTTWPEIEPRVRVLAGRKGTTVAPAPVSPPAVALPPAAPAPSEALASPDMVPLPSEDSHLPDSVSLLPDVPIEMPADADSDNAATGDEVPDIPPPPDRGFP